MLHTDGNAIAGLLEEIFGRDMTDRDRACHTCGAVRPIGAHRLHRGAGLVLRCPTCDQVAACITTLPNGYAVTISGTWLLEREI